MQLREEKESPNETEMKECTGCLCLGWAEGEGGGISHCTCCCRSLGGMGDTGLLEGQDTALIEEAAMLISTDRLIAGDKALDTNDVLWDCPLPELEEWELERVKMGQRGNISDKIRLWVGGGVLPDKGESLSLNTEEISVLRHVSLFKLNNQGIIFRLFVNNEGVVEILIFLEGELLIKMIWEVHEGLGHCAKKAVFEVFRKRYYGTNLRGRIAEVLKGCPVCIRFNIPKGVIEKQSTLVASQSREILQLDLLGPLPNSRGFRYIMCAVDAYDRSCYLKALKSTSADEMGGVLAKFFGEQGKWEYLKIDGRCLSFRGVDKKLVDKLGIGINRSNNTSRFQGIVERTLQTVLGKVLKLLEGEKDLQGWSIILDRVAFIVNSIPHEALNGRTPFGVIFRRPPALLPPLLQTDLGREGGEFSKLIKIAEDVRKGAYRNLVHNKSYRFHEEGLVKDEIVWRKRQSFARNMASKLQDKIVQAFRVLDRVGTGLYKVVDVSTGNIQILPGEQLIRAGMSEEEVKGILVKLNEKD